MGMLAQMRWFARLIGEAARGRQGRHRLAAAIAARRDLKVWARRNRVRNKPAILLGMTEHLGDIVAVEPIVRRIRLEHPEAHLVWAVRPAFADLVRFNPAVDEILPVRCLTHWMLLAQARGNGFNRVVDLHVAGRFCDVCNMALQKPPPLNEVTSANYYLNGNLLEIACRSAGLPEMPGQPQLHLSPDVPASVDKLNLPSRFIAVHCASNQTVRDWDRGKWPVFAQAIHEQHQLPVVEVGLTPLLPAGQPGVINLCGRLNLMETAEVIRRAAVFVGIDSGPAHLANAARTPGVVLLGRYRSYERYMPYSGGYGDGSNATIIQHDGPAAEIAVNTVLAAIQTQLSGVPA